MAFYAGDVYRPSDKEPQFKTLQTPEDLLVAGVAGKSLFARYKPFLGLTSLWDSPLFKANRLYPPDYSQNKYPGLTAQPTIWNSLKSTLGLTRHYSWLEWYISYWYGSRSLDDSLRMEEQAQAIQALQKYLLKNTNALTLPDVTFLPHIRQLILEYGWLPEVDYSTLTLLY